MRKKPKKMKKKIKNEKIKKNFLYDYYVLMCEGKRNYFFLHVVKK